MRYLGSKDKLIPAIQSLLSEKGLIDKPFVFFDAFCGTGAVANSFKNVFHLIINDSMNWSVLYSKGRIVGNTCTFDKLGFNPFLYFQKNQEIKKGFIYRTYSPAESNRMYFTPENAGRIDFIRGKIEEWKSAGLLSENEYAYLIYCLIEGVSSVSNTAGVYGAFLKHWDARSHNKLVFSPIQENLFSDTISHISIQTFCNKIEDIIENIECDILYLDPPYTQNQYGTQYHLLETLVLDDEPSVSAITGSRPVGPMKSMWSKDVYSQILFENVIAGTKAKHIIFSYNNDGFMSKEYIEATMKRYGKEESYTCVEIDYKKYNNFKCRGRDGHFEYLFYIEKKESNDVVYESPLNYSGSKVKMVPFIKSLLPMNVKTFVDVFGGGFNVGINVNAEKIIYNDINPFVVDLIKSFKFTESVDYLKTINKYIKDYNLAPNNKETYLKLRSIYNESPQQARSPLMLYALILFGFQQQIRFNSDYGFNIPCGSRRFNDRIIAKLVSFCRIIKEKNIEFYNLPFEKLFNMEEGDIVYYFDPPYRETTATYNDGKRGFEGWTIEHERRLCSLIDKLSEANVKCMFSYVLSVDSFYNHNVENWATNNGYRIVSVPQTQGRYNNRTEVLILNY